jgi:hypothetical protein
MRWYEYQIVLALLTLAGIGVVFFSVAEDLIVRAKRLMSIIRKPLSDDEISKRAK